MRSWPPGSTEVETTLPSLWQLRIFETVARLENLSKASEELLRSQPAISSSIVKLEEMLGVTLFDRARTGTYPTEVGVALQVRAQRILSAVHQALEEVCGLPSTTASLVATSITRTQMRCLVAISQAKSFAEAAKNIGISEASVQRAARQLERNIGSQLYKNTASGATTTAIGAELSKRMALIASRIEAAKDHVARYCYPSERSIVVGVLLLDPTILLTTAIREMGKKFNDVRLVMVSGSYESLLQKLNSGKIDLMIGLLKRPEYAENIREEPLYRDRYCVVARSDHPLTKKNAVSINDLRAYDWILPQRGSPRRLAFEHIFSDGAPPSASIETYSLSTIRVVLMESDMLTVLSATEMLCEEKIGLRAPVRFVVPDEGPMVGITRTKDWKPNAVQAAFLLAIKRASRQLQREYGFETASELSDTAVEFVRA